MKKPILFALITVLSLSNVFAASTSNADIEELARHKLIREIDEQEELLFELQTQLETDIVATEVLGGTMAAGSVVTGAGMATLSKEKRVNELGKVVVKLSRGTRGAAYAAILFGGLVTIVPTLGIVVPVSNIRKVMSAIKIEQRKLEIMRTSLEMQR